MVTPQQRRLAGPSYIAAASLIIFPIFDQLMQLVSTSKLHDARWRYGAAGLLSNLFVLPVVGLMIVFMVSTALEHRLFQRIMAALCALGVLGLVVAMGLFMLDSVQVRSLMRPEAMTSWAVATSTAVVKFCVAIAAIAWFALVGFRNSKASKSPQRSTAAGLVMGGSKAKLPASPTASES